MSAISPEKKRVLKELIMQLHAGAPPQQVKERFKAVLGDVSSEEIARIEQELVHEGLPREEIRRLCDVHMAVFREQIEKQRVDVPSGHPINILMEEHQIMLQIAGKLNALAGNIQQISDKNYVGDEVHMLEHISEDFRDSEKHYLREENVLFPTLDKHGITEPPAIMWSEHNQIREKKKQYRELVENYKTIAFEDFKKQLGDVAGSINELLPNHFFKENNILFPTAMRVIPAEEWKEIRKEFDTIGYCCFTPQELVAPARVEEAKMEVAAAVTAIPEGLLHFETGSMTKEETEALLDLLPIDITFIDKDDTVRYFNQAENRAFVRTKAVIGRKVQICHPQKSIDIVNHILDAFKMGRKNSAEFWIQSKGRLIHIRYFAVRDKNRNYLGTIETTQDITGIKQLEGEKRLLDWKE